MKSKHFSHSRWLIFLPVALFALFAPQPAHAMQVGLLVRGYSINEIPPTKSDIAYPMCGTSTEPFINATWDWQPYEQCDWDLFMLHYTGFLQIPEHQTIEFFVASDDGGTVKIGQDEFGVWQDQGCSATLSGELNIAAGTQPLDAWMYENGGGTCFMLAWNIDNTGWQIIQPEFFTSDALPAQSTTTTEPNTTTTEMPASTTETPSTNPPSTVATTTTGLPQTTTTIQETTSSTHPISVVPETTTSTTTTETPSPSPVILQIPEPTSSVEATVPPPPETIAPIITVNLPPQTTPEPPVSVPVASESPTTVDIPPSTFLLSQTAPDQPLSQEQFVEALSVLKDATPEQVQSVVTEILKADLNSAQAEQLVASPEVLTAITGDQAQQLFEQIEPAQLSESMAAVIADTLNNPDVPTEVKQAFEETINIFGNNGFSNYIPLGSVVNVAVRRTIIAGTTILVALPSPVSVRRNEKIA